MLLVECQSDGDRSAVRMLTCTGLLYQRLIDEGELRRRDTLPPVLPIIECETAADLIARVLDAGSAGDWSRRRFTVENGARGSTADR